MTTQTTIFTIPSDPQESLLGKGRTAEVYLWGEQNVIKLFNDGWPGENVRREWEISRAVSQAGLPAPVTGDLIRSGSRHGIVFERVNGKSLLTQFAAQPWSLFRAARLLARLHAEMHAQTIPGLPSQRQQIQTLIRRAPTLSPRLKTLTLERLDVLPDGEAVCHGDYHPDNVMVTPDGPVIIDWNTASQGNPLADVAYTSLLFQIATPPSGDSVSHFLMNWGRSLALELYLFHYRRLTGVKQAAIEAWALPIAVARLGLGVQDETDRLQKYLISLPFNIQGVSMTTLNLSAKTQPETLAGYPAATTRFHWIAVLLSFWLVTGLYLDGFVHHNFPQIVDSFFSPWHAYLYAGFFTLGIFFAANLAQNLRRGYPLVRALPKGYALAALGVPLFFAGGVGDMIWHEVFGFEENIEALLSPTHLLLAGSGFLLVSGGFRAAWLRRDDETLSGWRGLLPPLLSLTFMLSVLTFFSEYAHALTLPDAFVQGPQDGITHYLDVTGLAAVLIPTVLTSGIILLAIRRWTLPFGALSLILIGNNLLMAWFHARDLQGYVPLFGVMLLAGLAADLLNRVLHPGPDRMVAFRLFAFLVPVVTYSLFFGTLIATAGVWWSIHMWAGIIVQSGVIGLLVSWLVLPGGREAV